MFDLASFVIGFLLSSILGIISQQILGLQGPINAPRRPMSTFPDAAQPNLTSQGVVTTGQQARFRQGLFRLLYIAVLVTVGWLIWQWVSTSGISLLGKPACL
jgi:hypothetical protein